MQAAKESWRATAGRRRDGARRLDGACNDTDVAPHLRRFEGSCSRISENAAWASPRTCAPIPPFSRVQGRIFRNAATRSLQGAAARRPPERARPVDHRDGVALTLGRSTGRAALLTSLLTFTGSRDRVAAFQKMRLGHRLAPARRSLPFLASKAAFLEMRLHDP
jgi:hypothetical protein